MGLYGIETEYGISVEGKGPADLVSESRAVVNAYAGKFAKPWNYRGEDSRKDMRGFRVEHLTQNPEDAEFDDPSAPLLPAEQERADHVLCNGARLYNDHGHPEYSTPECTGLLDLVAHDKAGERIVLECARLREKALGAARISIYKNNTDFHGSSYGCHESYLMKRDRTFSEIVNGLVPFFVSRIIYAGAGKVGIEPGGPVNQYQLSQRADFFTEEVSVDTLHRRPLINTRDEPHADPRMWRRLHVICGDANQSEYATALKVGATSLVVRLLERGWSPGIQVKNPIDSIKAISRDSNYAWPVEIRDVGIMSAVEVQRLYQDAACRELAGSDIDTDWTLKEWRHTLDTLETDPMVLSDRLDWAAKKALIDDFVADRTTPSDDNHLQSLDLAYSNIDPEEGLFGALVEAGLMIRLISDDHVATAMSEAPANTRAALRGMLVDRFNDNIGSIGWSGVVLRHGNESWMADLSDYLTPERVEHGLGIIAGASSIDALVELFRN